MHTFMYSASANEGPTGFSTPLESVLHEPIGLVSRQNNRTQSYMAELHSIDGDDWAAGGSFGGTLRGERSVLPGGRRSEPCLLQCVSLGYNDCNGSSFSSPISTTTLPFVCHAEFVEEELAHVFDTPKKPERGSEARTAVASTRKISAPCKDEWPPGGYAEVGGDCDENSRGVSTVMSHSDLEGEGDESPATTSPLNEDDEVMGVTAEGDFIYRRDAHLGKELYREPSRFVPFREALCSAHETPCFTTRTAGAHSVDSSCRASALCNSESFVATTRVVERSSVGKWSACQGISYPVGHVPTPGHISPGQTGRGLVGDDVWTTEDFELCSLLMRYRVCENADESEYENLLKTINDLDEARRRYPEQVLERRLEEERCKQQSSRGSQQLLALRW
ncbi:hypothetical protein TRVL_05115 [Trypanosoma vivax]|nr:hypothetical protein TRVL_05115 [Trypanosoma vivax]